MASKITELGDLSRIIIGPTISENDRILNIYYIGEREEAI